MRLAARLAVLAPLAFLLVPGCSSKGSGGDAAAPAPAAPPFQELVDQGATRFFGKAKISDMTTDDAGNTTYTFDPTSGPVCLKGDAYEMSVRDTGSEGLFIFLQGGGACWSTFCLAINQAADGIPQKLDILDPTRPTNPLAGWSTVYLPYCDGSLFAGDADHDDDGDGKLDRQQHGLANLSAALDVAKARFPDPKRIVLAGSSGGGYGTITATLLVRAQYPNREILVFDDAGVGLGKPDDLGFVDGLLDEWNARSLIPKSCTECSGKAHLTPLVDWELSKDPQLKIAVFSSYEDYVISNVFLQIDPGVFHTTMLDESGKLHAAYPDRYRRFFMNGAVHTTLLGGIDGLIGGNLKAVTLPPGLIDKLGMIMLGGIDTSVVGGVSVATWFQGMLDGTPVWDDRLE